MGPAAKPTPAGAVVCAFGRAGLIVFPDLCAHQTIAARTPLSVVLNIAGVKLRDAQTERVKPSFWTSKKYLVLGRVRRRTLEGRVRN